MKNKTSSDREKSLTVKQTFSVYNDILKKWFKPKKRDTKTDKLLSYIYPISLITIVVITIVIYLFGKIKGKGWKWNEYLLLLIPVQLGGYIWTTELQTFDPAFPAWSYLPWTYSLIEVFKGTVLEDIWFFPVAALPLYACFVLIEHHSKKIKDFKHRSTISFLFLALICLIDYFFLVLTERFSWTTHQLFFPVAFVGYIVLWFKNVVHIKLVVLLVLIMSAFGFVWNFICVDLGRLIGLEFLSSWYYAAGKTGGDFLQSGVYVSKAKYPIAWILMSPVSMVIYMPLMGSWFGYVYLKLLREWRKVK